MSSVQDESYQQRITLICKPEQSGKTFVMIQQIIRDLKDPSLEKIVINIILCDNNLLLTKQTSERVKNDLSPLVEVNGESYLEFSSHARTEYRCAVAVEGAISVQDIRNILCCTNGTRVDDIYTIIRDLNNSEINKDKFFFKIWLDEADKYTGFIDTTFLPLVEKYENVAVYCITATPKKLFTHYHSLNVFPLENTTSPEYHGWTDNNIRLVDFSSTCIGFASYILDNMGMEHIQPGTKWYIPAEQKKRSHIAMKDVCVTRGFAVIIVNGDGIKLYLPNSELFVKKFKKDDELNTIIKRIYDRYELHKYPLAITGNVCIGRGISIMSKDFMIDFAILSSCYNQQEASQNAGRVKGNIKAWSTYKKPMVFTTEKFNKIAEEWEEKSRGLARLAFDKKLLGKSTIITKTEFKTIGDNYRYIVHDELFPSYSSAVKFLKTKKREMKTCVSGSKKGAIHTVDGYSITSKLLKPGLKVDSLEASDRLTMGKASQIGEGTNISSTDKGSRYLILPVYETMDSPPNSVRFQVRYISFDE